MKRQKRRYRKELKQAKTIIQKSPCANGDKEWCKTHATWKGLQKQKNNK